MRGLVTLTWIEMKLFVREPLAAFFTLVFPLLLVLVFGSVFGNAPSPGSGRFGFVDVAVPAYTVIIIGTSGLMSLTTTLASYRELGVLRRFRVTPLRPSAILVAQAIVMLVMTSLGMLLVLACGAAVFGLRCGGNVASLAAGFGLCCASIFALGFLLASRVASVRTAQALGMAVFYPMMFFSGAAIPRELLPSAVQRAAIVLPLTHAVTLLQGLWMGDGWQPHATAAIVLTSVGVVSVALAARRFAWE